MRILRLVADEAARPWAKVTMRGDVDQKDRHGHTSTKRFFRFVEVKEQIA